MGMSSRFGLEYAGLPERDEAVCYFSIMKTVFQFLSATFRLLILKPFDFLLFGGSGVLTISRAEWQKMIQNDVRSAGPYKEQVGTDDGVVYATDNAWWLPDKIIPTIPTWLNTHLPTIYDGPGGDAVFLHDENEKY
ncbi:hypothetical protein [Sulfuricystis multivorans]|uniref:hypothetical protein n=1 Tax=Sulfuricystis multivorans TaxID=2211108 RepID=UPI000F819827|nr:hypothetical protein [Sulfuricystis multivorans]